jgi:type VI secretion system protein ImpI
MSLLLTLEQGPRSQAVRQTRLDQGEMVIGRSPDADWQIDDPDMFISRAHCRISARQDGYFVTDTSSSGLFIDDADSPLGAGNSARLQHGMRLRLGDYVLGVEMQGAETRPAAPQPPAGSRAPVNLGHDDFFSARAEPEPPRQRPSGLPDPFEQPKPGAYRNQAGDDNAPRSPAFDDPFSLDPVATPEPSKVGRSNGAAMRARAAPASPAEPWLEKPAPRREPTTSGDGFGLGAPVGKSARASRVGASVAPASEPPAPWDLPARSDNRSGQRQPPAKATPRPRQAEAVGDTALHAAFLRGAGMDEADASGRDPVDDMEKFGREYRLMLEGLMQLLRKRAEEKGNARLEQTVVGASDVNPLKFLPTADDALATIFAERSPGFLAGEAAIADAVRDLAEHHVRAWRGVQAALRRMIDRFDPAAIEEELKSGSALGTLLSGGRGAKLWELYQKRHREIAQSAEQRFLGEIGADFRDAYEEE